MTADIDGLVQIVRENISTLDRIPTWRLVVEETSKTTEGQVDARAVDTFLSGIAGLRDLERANRKSLEITRVVNKLLQTGYDQGIDAFEFNTYGLELFTFGRGLKGEEDRPLKLKIHGDVGVYCFDGARHVDAEIEGNCERESAERARNVKITANEIGERCAIEAQDCKFYAKEGFDPAYCGYDADRCVFKTGRAEDGQYLLHFAKRDVGNTNLTQRSFDFAGNRVILVNEVEAELTGEGKHPQVYVPLFRDGTQKLVVVEVNGEPVIRAWQVGERLLGPFAKKSIDLALDVRYDLIEGQDGLVVDGTLGASNLYVNTKERTAHLRYGSSHAIRAPPREITNPLLERYCTERGFKFEGR